jgi:hypothetical protein
MLYPPSPVVFHLWRIHGIHLLDRHTANRHIPSPFQQFITGGMKQHAVIGAALDLIYHQLAIVSEEAGTIDLDKALTQQMLAQHFWEAILGGESLREGFDEWALTPAGDEAVVGPPLRWLASSLTAPR